jgi:hypothetical protein
MDRREGKHGKGAEKDGEDRAPSSLQMANPGRGPRDR